MKVRSRLTDEVSNLRGDIAREMIRLGIADEVPEDSKVVDIRAPHCTNTPRTLHGSEARSPRGTHT